MQVQNNLISVERKTIENIISNNFASVSWLYKAVCIKKIKLKANLYFFFLTSEQILFVTFFFTQISILLVFPLS